MSLVIFDFFLDVWLVLALALLLSWLYQNKTKDASFVDVCWTFGIGLSASYYAIVVDASLTRKIFVLLLAGAWSLRLGIYLLRDRVIAKDEDGRYKAMREHWGDKVNFYHFFFFQAQALHASVVSLTFLAILLNPETIISQWEIIGLIVWTVSLVCLTISDRQLANFRKDSSNKGLTCRVGLWNYSRHPNYFFEWLIWFSYAVMTIGSPYFWLSLAVSIVMYIFITRISGIPFTEMQALKSRPEDYKKYQQTTNAFFPWVPRKL